MNLGNLNLHVSTASVPGEAGGGNSSRKNQDATPEGGVFAALLGALFAGAESAAPEANGAQAQNSLAIPMRPKGRNNPASGLIQEQATVEAEGLVAGGGKGGSFAAGQSVPLPTPGANANAAASDARTLQVANEALAKAALQTQSADLETPAGPNTPTNPDTPQETSPAKASKTAKMALLSAVQQQTAERSFTALAQTDASAERSETSVRELLSGTAPATASEGGDRAKAASAQQGAQTIVSQVAQQLSYAARGGMQQIRFQLHPAELGQVSVQLKIREGGAKVVISAENPAAIESMRQAASALHQSLQAAGMQLDRDNLQFQQQGGGEFSFGDEAQRENGRAAQEDADPVLPRMETADASADAKNEDGLFL